MRTADFDYDLPAELIAQIPAAQRDQSRLMVLDRHSTSISHKRFPEFVEHLVAGDVLVLNNSRVIPARLRGVNARSGGQFEVLVLEENSLNDWWVMIRPGKRARVGTEIIFGNSQSHPKQLKATVIATNDEGHRRLRFSSATNFIESLDALGEVPLPPYISREHQLAADRERYQTVFAQTNGSVAAPTAGLHFTQALLDEIRSRGVQVCFVTLHVGLGTFAPVKSVIVEHHVMHDERYEVGTETADTINEAKRESRQVIAVGTTTVRVLESVARANAGRIVPGPGRTRIFIHPPFAFQIVDALLTNFHLPRSTLLMLVSAFAAPRETRGREIVLTAYTEAIRERYRFFSYGDAMLIA